MDLHLRKIRYDIREDDYHLNLLITGEKDINVNLTLSPEEFAKVHEFIQWLLAKADHSEPAFQR